MRENKLALIAIIAIALWIFVALPLIYLPDHSEFWREPLGIKLGEWLLSFATFGLWYATWRLVKGADQTAQRQLRAYVGAFEISLTSQMGTFTSVVKTKNFGATPASNFRTSLRLHLIPAPVISTPLHDPDWLSAGVSLMPGEETITVCELFMPAPQILPDLQLGRLAICLSGYIDYEDSFGRKRRTIVRRIATGPRAATQNPFIHAPEGDVVI